MGIYVAEKIRRYSMNIIFFMTDQHNADCLGFMGHPLVKTPTLDSLAAKGAYFNKMFSCSAICSPSRTSFFTGTYLRTHEQFFNNSDLRRKFPSMVGELKEQGYTTFECGKNHLPPKIAKDFDEMWTERRAYKRYLKSKGLSERPMTEEIDKNFMSFVSSLPEEDQIEVWTANRAIDFLKAPKAKSAPFFMWCSFERPHAPLSPPASFDNLYNPDDIEVDWDEYSRFELSRMQNRPMREDFWKIGSVRHDISIFKKAVCRYLALITLIDREIGRILEVLSQEGLEEETVIIFTADHGDFAGHYGQVGKNLPGYDDLIRIPFIYYDPKREGDAGRVVEGMCQNIDLFPTLMERLGLEIPPTVQGVSFLKALAGRPGSGREYVFSETSMEKTIRSRDWKLTFFVRHPHKGQLFRMGPAPDETRNLWDDPAYTEVKKELMEGLVSWMVRCEQSIVMDSKWEEYIPTRWYNWLSSQPDQNSIPEPELPNEK
jgi:arylsulfatase A-like enzyme